jgi:hypothetical protein
MVVWITVYLKEKVLGIYSRNTKKEFSFVFINNFNGNYTAYSVYRTAVLYVPRRWKLV